MITRIRELLENRQLSPTQFADLIGVGRPVISHILSERNKPSLEVVQKIIGAFPEISLPWLLAGTGPMLAATSAPPSSPFSGEIATPPAPAPSISTVATPSATLPPITPPNIHSASPDRAITAAPPSRQPQPSKFRPSAPPTAATPSPSNTSSRAVSASMAPSPVADVVAVPPASPSPVIGSFSPPEAIAASSSVPALPAQVPSAPQPTIPAPIVPSNSPIANTSLATPIAERPAVLPTSPEPDASSQQAAALSFLGEPGKAIRRIVIFYRDGSFSDFLPEGS
jgi:transcriptional regulator with XRE-family HTH domain